MRQWVQQAIYKIEADFQRSSDTHLLKLDIPSCEGITLYLKDESTHPTGSLKHRLARSLFLYGLCNGHIIDGTTIIEASSGNTAVSEAYFAHLLGLPFIAVMPKSTSKKKVDQITFYQGKCHFVDEPSEVYAEAERLADELNGHYMDQFTNAEKVTDWRGNNNIAESIFLQMKYEPFPDPKWIVVSAGTGGTSATIGRYIQYRHHNTSLCVADPENSVFYDYFHKRDKSLTIKECSQVEGIGRPRVEPSFIPMVIDRMEKVSNEESYGAIHFLEKIINRKCGGSTGTNFIAACRIIAEMARSGESGSVVSMICDDGNRYLDTYFDESWLREQGIDLETILEKLSYFYMEDYSILL